MKIAIISDIHGNYEALKEVMNDIKRLNIKQIICLGDLVGYGPEPEKVIKFIKRNKIPCVLGNHELAIWDDKELNSFNRYGRDSILLTRELISKESLDYIKKLPQKIIKKDILFVHGCPPNLVSEYISVLLDKEIINIFKKLKQRIAFIGHTHELSIYSYNKKNLVHKYLHKGKIILDKNKKHIVNAGSVGQPRDGNNNAKYIIFDDKETSIDVKFIPYNIKITADLIKRLGFPKFNAKRLL